MESVWETMFYNLHAFSQPIMKIMQIIISVAASIMFYDVNYFLSQTVTLKLRKYFPLKIYISY